MVETDVVMPGIACRRVCGCADSRALGIAIGVPLGAAYLAVHKCGWP